MRYNVVVTRKVNKQPRHVVVREHGIKPAKIERIFADVVQEEYERLTRSGMPINGKRLGDMRVIMYFRDGSTSAKVLIEGVVAE